MSRHDDSVSLHQMLDHIEEAVVLARELHFSGKDS
jgi:hypothetical protein